MLVILVAGGLFLAPACKQEKKKVVKKTHKVKKGDVKVESWGHKTYSGAVKVEQKKRVKKKIKVKIPAGVDTGIRLRVSDEGDAGDKGGPRGDLYVVIYVKEHDFFQRHDNDIYCSVKVNFTQAVFGSEIDVPVIDGKTKLKIPTGTESGKIFRLKQKGVPRLMSGSGRGDQLVKVSVDVPKRLTDKQKNILSEFAKTLGEKKQAKSFLEKVKDSFKE